MTNDFEDHCWQDIVSSEILEIYAAYQRPTFVGDKPALLAIDLYNKAYTGGPLPVREANKLSPGSCGENAWKAIEPTKALFAAARRAKIPVIYTTSGSRNNVVATNRRQGSDQDDRHAIKSEFTPQSDDLIIYKERASGFFGTPLIAHLQMLGIKSLIICGESTSGCVRATAVDGYSYGFHVAVAEECVFDRSLLSHKVNLFDLHHKYADVLHVDEVLSHLEKLAIST